MHCALRLNLIMLRIWFQLRSNTSAFGLDAPIRVHIGEEISIHFHQYIQVEQNNEEVRFSKVFYFFFRDLGYQILK